MADDFSHSPVALDSMGDVLIGADVGGTHTDVQVVAGARLARGKALTTYDDFSRGLLDAIAVAAEDLGLSLNEVLARARAIVNGTTVATNVVTQLRGARVGVLVTAGFRDTFRIAGGPRLAVFDDHLQVNVPDVVDRRAIVEVEGRIDAKGQEIVPLDLDGVTRGAEFLVNELGVDAIAVCLLSSYQEPKHELMAEERVLELFPDVYVSVSHRLFPVKGETRRWTTAVLNAFVHADTHRYVESVDGRLRAAGFEGALSFFQGLGGAISRGRAERFPLSLLGSGPAGGAVGAAALARQMGREHVLLADMGGTSFDTGLIHGHELRIEKNVDIGRFPSGLNLVDIVSVGAGGGSIVSVSDRGVPQVGPRSAGSTPGPACYGRGGRDATVTDALVAMGLIDPDNYLGGRMALQPELAAGALRSALGERFGWDAEQAGAVVYELVVANMANAIREVTISKGYDPRDFLFLAYGGTLPLFAWAIASTVGISEVVVPDGSSVFCARGLLAADVVLRYDQSVKWHLAEAGGAERVNAIGERLVAHALEDMRAEGFDEEAVTVIRRGDFQFPGQVFQLSMPVPEALTEADIATVTHRFFELYEQTYGRGTAWVETPPIMVNYTVEVRGRRPNRLEIGTRSPEPATAEELLKGRRRVYLPLEGRHCDVPVYDDARFSPGSSVAGPAIIDARDTTILVPSGVTAARDELMNYRLSWSDAPVQRRGRANAGYDPVATEVHRKAIENIVNEMAVTLVRTSGSPVVSHAKDFSTCLLDERGEQLALSCYVLIHSASAWLNTQALIEQLERDDVTPRPGDGWIVNDPYDYGAQHQGDVAIIMPTFYRGEHIGWAFSNLHVLDIGGISVSGVAPGALSVYDEALRFPGLQIIREGHLDDEWKRYIAHNVRIPGPVLNDIRSMIAANNVAQMKLEELVDRVGIERHREHNERNKQLTETLLRRRIEAMPDGRYEAVEYLEFSGRGTDELVEIRCALTVEGSELHFAFSGDPQVQAPVNGTIGAASGHVMTHLLTMLAYGDLPFNAGMWRPIRDRRRRARDDRQRALSRARQHGPHGADDPLREGGAQRAQPGSVAQPRPRAAGAGRRRRERRLRRHPLAWPRRARQAGDPRLHGRSGRRGRGRTDDRRRPGHVWELDDVGLGHARRRGARGERPGPVPVATHRAEQRRAWPHPGRTERR